MAITKAAMQHPGATNHFRVTVLRRKHYHMFSYQKPDKIITTVPMSLMQQASIAKRSTHPSQIPKSSESSVHVATMQAT
jgi:hypothetical protein